MINTTLNAAYTHTPGVPVGDSHFSIQAAAPLSEFMKYVMVSGNCRKDIAKITGITPA